MADNFERAEKETPDGSFSFLFKNKLMYSCPVFILLCLDRELASRYAPQGGASLHNKINVKGRKAKGKKPRVLDVQCLQNGRVQSFLKQHSKTVKVSVEHL